MLRPVALALLFTVSGVGSTAAFATGAKDAPHGVALAKSVYAGSDGGAGCAEATSFTEAGPNDTVTYCFVVTNTGPSTLVDITIDDPHIEAPIVLLDGGSSPLAPGDQARYYVVATPPPDDADGLIDDTYTNVATVTAKPSDGAGNPLDGVEPVTESAEAIVFRPEIIPAPAVALSTTVYAGHDGGQGCPAADLALVDEGGPITFCYAVTNTGNTHLAAIGVAHPGSGGSPSRVQADSDPLAPDHSAHWVLETTAPAVGPEGVVVTASVSANPVDGSGADLTGLDDVRAEDGTEIASAVLAQLEPAPELPAPSAAAVVTDPAPDDAASADPEPAPAEPAAQAAQTQAPEQLAYTGWETWMLIAGGIGLLAGGVALLQEAALRRKRMVRLPVQEDRAVRAVRAPVEEPGPH
jgi:hypothetical protein